MDNIGEGPFSPALKGQELLLEVRGFVGAERRGKGRAMGLRDDTEKYVRKLQGT